VNPKTILFKESILNASKKAQKTIN